MVCTLPRKEAKGAPCPAVSTVEQGSNPHRGIGGKGTRSPGRLRGGLLGGEACTGLHLSLHWSGSGTSARQLCPAKKGG